MKRKGKKIKVLKIKKNQLYFLLFILLIIGAVFAGRGYRAYKLSKLREANTIYYNNFKFVRSDGMWVTDVKFRNNVYQIPFRFFPAEVENVTEIGELKIFPLDTGYITFNPDDPELKYVALAAAELSINLANVLGSEFYSACTKEWQDVCPPKPVVTCNSTNSSVFYIKVANSTAIEFKDNCIILQGKGFGLVKAVDKVLYMMYGII